MERLGRSSPTGPSTEIAESRSAAGNRRAVVYEGVSFRARRGDLKPETSKPSRKFRVWLSDDADRVPLKVVANTELGEVVMSLTEYSRP